MRRALVPFALFALAACEPAGSGNIVDLDATGTVVGVVFVDANASGSLDAADGPAVDIPLALVQAGSADTVANTRTDADGLFAFPFVPVGRYTVVLTPTALGDTMSVVFRDPPGLPVGQIDPDDDLSVTIGQNDSAEVRIGIGYPVLTVDAARSLPAGRRVFVRAVVTAAVGSAADSTLFLEGGSRGIAVRRSPAIAGTPGDSVLVFARTATRDGQPVLTEGSASVTAFDAPFDTIPLFAADARRAGGGVHDARLARVSELVVTDTARAGGRFLMTAEDPSGSVIVSIPVAGVQLAYVPGFEFDVVGVLVARAGQPNVWEVRPRQTTDLIASGP